MSRPRRSRPPHESEIRSWVCPCCLQEMDVEPGRKPPKNQNTYRYAPNLLKALKQMVEQYGGMVDGGVEPSAARAVSYARAVIAKAERRS